MSVDVLLDIDPLVLEELDAPIPCEGEQHAAGRSGHVTSTPAAWLQCAPTHPCGRAIYKCDGYRQWFASHNFNVICGVCRGRVPHDDVVFIPINEDVS